MVNKSCCGIGTLLLLVAFASTFAQAADAPPTVDVWPARAPDETRHVGPEKTTKDSVERVTDISKPTLTLYPAPKGSNTEAAVIICPGGGYSILAWDLEGTEVASWLNSIGVNALILKYRVPVRRSDDVHHFMPLEDAQRAVSLVRSKAKEWDIDPKRIGMLGFSAGGNLTALACTNYDHRSYEAVDAADQISCRPDFGVLIYPAWLIADGKDELRPEFPVNKKTPPMFLAQAGDDPINAENVAVMYLALKHAGVAADLHIYAKGGHGFGLRPSKNPCYTWPQRCAEWMASEGLLKNKAAARPKQ
jgi:acetyl esterase/lipase